MQEQLLLPRGGLAPRGAGRDRGDAGARRAGADRPRRRPRPRPRARQGPRAGGGAGRGVGGHARRRLDDRPAGRDARGVRKPLHAAHGGAPALAERGEPRGLARGRGARGGGARTLGRGARAAGVARRSGAGAAADERSLRRPAPRAGGAPPPRRRGRGRGAAAAPRSARTPPARRGDGGAVPRQGTTAAAGRAGLRARRRDAGRRGAADQAQRRARAENRLRLRRAVRRRSRGGRAHARGRPALPLPARPAALPLPVGAAAGGADLVGVAAPARRRGGPRALRGNGPGGRGRGRGRRAAGRRAGPARPRAGGDRRARLLRLLPDDVGDRPFLRRARDPLPGARLGRQLRGLLRAGDHRGRPGADESAVRALPVERARRAARHRPRHRARAARGGDPARLREVRPRPRGDGREPGPLPAALGGARPGQGAGAGRDDARPAGQAAAALGRGQARAPRGGRARPGLAGPRPAARAGQRSARLPAAPVDPPRRVPAGPRAGLDDRPDRERDDGGADRHPVGQERRRGPRAVQGRPARAWVRWRSSTGSSACSRSTVAWSCRWRRSRPTTPRPSR